MRFILIKTEDNVCTALFDLKKGENIKIKKGKTIDNVILQQDIKFGHKFAIQNIKKRDSILKYGLPIGMALHDIGIGELVHIHNCQSKRFGSLKRNMV